VPEAPRVKRQVPAPLPFGMAAQEDVHLATPLSIGMGCTTPARQVARHQARQVTHVINQFADSPGYTHMPRTGWRLGLLAICLLLLPGTAIARQTPPVRNTWPPIALTESLSVFEDAVIDEARQRIYASERNGGRVFIYSLPSMQLVGAMNVGPAPSSMSLSPDGHALAIAMGNAAIKNSIAIVDLDSLAVVSRITVATPPEPSNRRVLGLVYGRVGRLYVLGAETLTPGTRLYAFDTDTGLEVGRSVLLDPLFDGSRLAISGDGTTMYVANAANSSDPSNLEILRLDLSTDTPRLTAQKTGPAPDFVRSPPESLPMRMGAWCSRQAGRCGQVT
jgi:hypothetical protein